MAFESIRPGGSSGASSDTGSDRDYTDSRVSALEAALRAYSDTGDEDVLSMAKDYHDLTVQTVTLSEAEPSANEGSIWLETINS